MGQPGGGELGDELFHHRVPAVVGLHLENVAVSVGDHGVVSRW